MNTELLDGPTAADADAEATAAQGLDAIAGIPVQMQVVLGATTMAIADLLALRRGAIVSLDRRIGEPVDIVVNGRIVARGDLQVLDGEGERFGVSVTEIVGRGGSLQGLPARPAL